MTSAAGRVLLVDVDAGFRDAAVSGLRRHGLVCDGVARPADAVALLQRGAHDVLVLDVGPAANRRLLLHDHGPAALAVIAVARRRSVDGALAALRARAVDYLTKPIRIPVLVETVQRAVERAEAVRGVRRAERLIALCAEWIHLLDAMVAAPGPVSLPPSVLAAVRQARPDDEQIGRKRRRLVTSLSPREQQVLLAFGSGLRVRQIARALGVSVHTARAHLKAIMRKLGVHSQTALLERLHAAGGVSPEAS